MGGQDVVPEGSSLPWNRHQRRRHRKAKGIVIHLFSGGRETSKQWSQGWSSDVEAITLDVESNPQENLHHEAIWGYMCHLARTKRIVAILGGPPCRTVSRLRNIRPGPNPLRDRVEKRFGLPPLTKSEKLQTDSDAALLLKQLALRMLAEEHCSSDVPPAQFVLESPEDPASYTGEQEAPTFWAWPEMLQRNSNLVCVFCSLIRAGWDKTKPTGCLTNLKGLFYLDQLRRLHPQGEPLREGLQARFQQTSQWSARAPGFKKAIRDSLVELWGEHARSGLRGPQIKKGLTQDRWREHIPQGHTPFRRDCGGCVLNLAAGKPHRGILGARRRGRCRLMWRPLCLL